MKNFIKLCYGFMLALASFNPIALHQKYAFGEQYENFLYDGFGTKKKTRKGRRWLQKRGEVTTLRDNMNGSRKFAANYENVIGDETYESENLQESYDNLTAGEIENIEGEYYEQLEELGGNEHLARKRMVKRFGKKGAAVMKYGLGTKSKFSTLTGGIRGIAATATIQVKRLTANIAQNLPIEIFNLLDNYSDNTILRRYLPAGVTLASSNTDATRTNWVFTFQSGAVFDSVVISCSELSYNKLQLATHTDLMRVGKTTYKISDKTQQTQFDQKFIIVEQTMFGKGKENPITPTSFVRQSSFREDIIEMPVAYDIDKQNGIVVSIINVANFTVTFALSITMFNQWDKTNMRRK